MDCATSNTSECFWNEKGLPRKEVLRLLSQYLSHDASYESGRILGSMCTKPHSFARQIYSKYLEKNLGDPGLFPGVAELEKEVIKMIGSLVSNPNAFGNIVSGGTEANILAMWAARKLTGKNEIIVPASAHFSFDRGADLLGIKLIKAKLNESFQVDVADVERLMSDNTAMIVGIAGTTALGVVDPIKELSSIALNHGVYLHVDAAFGGFVLPFLEELGYHVPEFDFRLPGVYSMTIDPHKMGMAPIPAGGILFREDRCCKAISIKVPYLSGGEAELSTLSGTRSGASIISVWALLKHLGREYYRKVVKNCMMLTHHLAKRIDEMKNFRLVTQPTMNIVGITSDSIKITRVAEELRKKGWKISCFPTHIRVVIMPHLRIEHIEEFCQELQRLDKSLKRS